VAVGSGWQSYVAYINLACYYIIGVPLGFLMGWVFDLGVMVCLMLPSFRHLCSHFTCIINYILTPFGDEIEQRESGLG